MRNWVSIIATAGLFWPAVAAADTLPEALAKAYETNPTLAAQRAVTRQTDEASAQALAAYLPQVSVNGAYTQRRVETETGTTRTKSTTEPNSYGLQVSQSLFEGGRRLAQSALVEAQIDGAQEGLRATEQQVLLSAIAAYVNVRRDEEALAFRVTNVALLEEQLRAAQERFEVGVLTRTDVAQAEARLAGAKAGLAGARADLEASRANYEQVIGQAPGKLEAPPATPQLPATLAEAVDIAVEANPDLRRAETGVRAAREIVRIEGSELLPSLSVVGRVDQTFDQAGTGVDQEISTATAQLSIPLFEGGFARSRTRAAKIGVARAEAETEVARRAVVSRVVSAWNDHQASLSVIEASSQQVKANTLALEGVTLEYEGGERTTLDVLDARQELLQSQLALVSAERDAYVAASALLVAIGKLDARTLALSSTPYDPNVHRRSVQWRILSTEPASVR